ncbi:MAG TPA: hypothetical protein VGS80_05390 [Ktedonobacterales bacterium]|nr:hypothetical protein [Ktedonobacterales bacterium]
MDEFELERSHLRAGGPAGAAHDAGGGMGSAPPSVRRRRRVGMGAAVLCAALAVLVAAVGLPKWSTAVSLLGIGGAQKHAGAAFLTLDVIDSVPWGTLFVDDAVLGQPYVVLTLEPGIHSVHYVAAPFPELRCVVSVPLAASDTCKVRPARSGAQGTEPPALDLEATFERLPAGESEALARAVQIQLSALTSATAVEPGEQYVSSEGTVAVAREPIAATLTYDLNLDERRADPFNTPAANCAMFCVAPGQVDLLNGRWQIYAHLLIRWRYSPPHAAAFYSFLTPANSQDVAMPVDAFWTGRWQAVLGPDTPRGLCLSAGFLTEDLALPPPGSFSEDEALAPRAADGCLLTFTAATEGTPVVVQRLRVLYRFGLLQVADAQTHGWLRALPLATPAEQALARQIAG